MQKDKKIILISGTSSGIGKYLALNFSKKHTVIGISRKNIILKKKNYFHYKLDLNNFNNMQKTIGKIFKKFGKIDILINNAGTNVSHGNIYFVNRVSIEKTIQTNLTSTILLTKEVLRNMVINKSGKIINIASSVVNLLPEGESVYAASKAGLVTFTKILSKELKNFNISCNCISPFILDTPMIKKIKNDKINDILKKRKKKKNKLFEIFKIIEKVINNKINGKNIFL